MTRAGADVIVVGAGPAGAATAIHLVRRGRRILLLDKCTFPRDKSCGDGLTRAAVSSLDDLGVLSDLPEARTIRGARLFIRGKGSRDFTSPNGGEPSEIGLVVPRLDLDAALCRRAVAEGAELWQHADVRRLLFDKGRVVGVEVAHQGTAKAVHAPITVAADGAASRLAMQAGLMATAARDFGFAVRGYYSGVHGLTDLFEFYAPLLDATDRFLLPSYGWVFPTGADSVNVGVGVFHNDKRANVRRLMNDFIAFLGQTDPRFSAARPCSRWTGAPLRFDFAPERCMTAGLILVGDAAGLISPFTGEGISYALESGRIAAEVIDGSLSGGERNEPDLSDYPRCLAAAHAGYFEAGRHAARRYVLIWHVLESTLHSDRPLFALCRRAALFPEGIGEAVAAPTAADVNPFLTAPMVRLRSDLEAVSGLVTEVVRREWPVLAQLTQPPEQEVNALFRPAVLLLLTFYAGSGREDRAVLAAAAVELGYLAALAHSSVDEEPPAGATENTPPPAHWGNLFALSVGDFLLSKAHELSAKAGPNITAVLSRTLASATEAQVTERSHAYRLDLSTEDHLDIIGRKTAGFFELPCRLGAEFGTLPPAHVEAAARYGRELGIIYHLVEEILDCTERGQLLGSGANLGDGIYGLPVRCAARMQTAASEELHVALAAPQSTPDHAARVRRLVRETNAISEVIGLALDAKQRAHDALRTMDDTAIRKSLWGLPDSALSRLNA